MTTAPQTPPTPHSGTGPPGPQPGKTPPLLVGGIAVAQFGLFLALMTPILTSLQIKVQDIADGNGQVAALGIVTSTGSVAALLANPVFGRISDRTGGRFGRRRPWMVLGMLGLLVSLLVMALAPNVATLTAGFFLGSVAANAALAAFVATIADQVPAYQRGKVSGMVGIMQNLAPTTGTWIAQYFTDNMVMLFLVPGVIGTVMVAAYVLILPDKPLASPPAREGWKAVLSTFWVSPRRYPDFAWAWASRFLLTLASWMFMTFRLIYLQNELSLPLKEATATMATGAVIYGGCVMAAAQTAGWLSDRTGRRKPFIAVATVVFGLGMLILGQADTLTAFYAAEAVLGIGFGAYMGVDLALVIDVLPDPDNPSKDLGIFNIAMAGPQVFAPAMGALLISAGGGDDFSLLLTGACVISLLGAAAILPVKKVR